MNWIISRLREPSSWRGIAALAGIAGYAISPERLDAISAAVMAILALIEVMRKEKGTDAKPTVVEEKNEDP